MSTATKSVWLGYRKTGGKFETRQDEMNHGIALLGHGSKELATLYAYACNEAGLRTLVLDLDGHFSSEVSGYLDSYDVSYFLYDACRISERAGTHGQLAASAYTSTLNLTFEQEGIINAAMGKISDEKGVASPSGLIGFLGSAEGFRANSVDMLRGRLTYLRSLDMIGEADIIAGEMLKKSCIANFSKVELPEAAELGAALLIAKMLSLEADVRPDAVILSEAHRLFPFHAVVNHSARLLNSLLSTRIAKVLASELPGSLDKNLINHCPTRIVSSAVWNETSEGLLLTPNMFMVQNTSYGHDEPVIPRPFEPSSKDSKTGAAASMVMENKELVKMILDVIATGTATRKATVAWLSADYPPELVEKTIDTLKVQGYITSGLIDTRGDSSLPVLTLTDSGRQLLEQVR